MQREVCLIKEGEESNQSCASVVVRGFIVITFHGNAESLFHGVHQILFGVGAGKYVSHADIKPFSVHGTVGIIISNDGNPASLVAGIVPEGKLLGVFVRSIPAVDKLQRIKGYIL